MKKLWVLNARILIIIFLTAGIVSGQGRDDKLIKELILQRVEILSDYYSREADFDQAKARLETVAAGELLQSDLALMEKYGATDFEQVTGCRAAVESEGKNSHDIVTGEVEITWDILGYEGERRENNRYFFAAEDSPKKLKLTQLRKL